MHIHILGICGTFMGGIAALAKAAGYRVTGSDANVYPPMSNQLKRLEVELIEGWDVSQLDPAPDCVVIGNAMSRGNPVVEAVLNRGLPYRSGPQWLAEHVLQGRHVFAVAGTHGKTTTSSMLAWILEDAGMKPGFLIGGSPANFDFSARLGDSRFFVVEADEYDTAFFDKRAKFVHYGPRTVILNNLEFDHADIYKDVDAILWQVHQLLRIVPGEGRVLVNGRDANLARALAMDPEVVLYDEPTSGLDPVSSRSIDVLIDRLRTTLGVTSVVVTHDLHSALAIGSRIAMLSGGQFVEVADPAGFIKSDSPVVKKFLESQYITKQGVWERKPA